MSSTNANPASDEQMEKFIEDVTPALKEHEEEKRRSLEIHTGFFEKLSTLNAGSKQSPDQHGLEQQFTKP
jgi:hypothetical protein